MKPDSSGKRAFDLVVSLLLLPLILLAMALVACAVRVLIGAPVMFVQTRAGLGGRAFTMYKFRTMTDARDKAGELLPDNERMTPFGRWLRGTSLDELPEFINVVRGEMSLVGPRPLFMRYLPLYAPGQARRHEVKPGITGWAQVGGRNALSWDEKFRLDVWYVDNMTIWLDLRILWMTIWKVLGAQGIGHGQEATMPEFKGSAGHSDKT